MKKLFIRYITDISLYLFICNECRKPIEEKTNRNKKIDRTFQKVYICMILRQRKENLSV